MDEDEVDKPDGAEDDEGEGPELREDDRSFIEACEVLDQLLDKNRRELYYHRQLTVLFEKKWFHWITGRALRRLVDLGQVATNL